MALVWTLPGFLGLAGFGLGFALATAILFRRPGRLLNQAAAATLYLDAFFVLGTNGVLYLTDDPATGFGSQLVGYLAGFGWLFAYPMMLSTLDSPLAGPFRSRGVRGALFVLVAAGAAALVLRPQLMIGPRAEVAYAQVEWLPGPAAPWLALGIVALLLYGTAVSLHAWRRARTPEARSRGGWFALAFGARDGVIVATLVLFYAGFEAVGAYGSIAVILYTVASGYAILRGQLFDLDLRIKVGVERSTIAAAFVVVYLLASEVARALLAPQFGVVAGIAAAALLVVAIAPLQRAAERFAGRVVPGASEVGLAERKLDVYRAELASAYEAGEGRILPEDARYLARLRATLGLSERDHALLDYGVRAKGSAPALPGVEALESMGRFRVARRLGAGSFGQAYLARDERLGRDVVLKVLEGGVGETDAILREARALASLRHQNVVTLFDADRIGAVGYLVLEHVEGGSLRDRLDRGPLTPSEFARVADGLLAGLAAVHAVGIVHRDVKPSNVLLSAEGGVKIGDFGIAHLAGFEATIDSGQKAGATGTVRYMSPEQARGRAVGPASDLYGAAAVLFEAWTGAPYHRERPQESALELQIRIAGGGAFEVTAELPEPLLAWLRRGLASDPSDRFASAEAMRAALPLLAP